MKEKLESPLGPALRAIRRRLGITLTEVAKRTGITASTLSRVENGGATLTYDKLIRLAEGLGLDIVELFRPASDTPRQPAVTARRSVERADGVIVDTRKYIYRYLHTDLSGKKLVPVISERLLHNVKDFGEYHRHSGEEFVFVLEGTMELHTEFYAPIRVEVGHSVYIDSTMGHAYIAVGETPCRILAVMTAPEGELRTLSSPSSAATGSSGALNPSTAPTGRPSRLRSRPPKLSR